MNAPTRGAALPERGSSDGLADGAARRERRWRRSAAIPGSDGGGGGSESAVGGALIRLVRLYQRAISPFLPPLCRYYPTCSQYAVEAVQARGVWTGLRLALWRLLRCNPFCRGGFDPVPPPRR